MHRAQHPAYGNHQSHTEVIPSPVGTLLIQGNGDGVTNLRLGHPQKRALRMRNKEHSSAWSRACARYFQGDMEALNTVHIKLHGTAFQCEVWEAARRIPVGKTISYAALSKAIGKPKAFRAVAQALKRNPIALIIPCHRVVPSTYTPQKPYSSGGFAWGKARKTWLLQHEMRQRRTKR